MLKSLLSTCLLLALLSSVTSLKCSSCRSNETSCESRTKETCNSDQTCVSAVLHNNIDPKRKMATIRGCVPSNACHTGDYSFSSANGKFLQMKTFCCHTEECNKEPVHIVKREDLSPNGRQCPACYSRGYLGEKLKCESQGNVSCFGNETKCIDFSGHIARTLEFYDLKFKGCATEDFCALDGKNIGSRKFSLNRIKAKCYDAEES